MRLNIHGMEKNTGHIIRIENWTKVREQSHQTLERAGLLQWRDI